MKKMISEKDTRSNTQKFGLGNISFSLPGVIIILFVIVLFSMLLSFTAYSFYMVQEVQILEMEVSVGEVVGVNVDSDKLYFGTILPLYESESRREATFRNNYDFPVEVSVFFTGEMKDWVTLEEIDPVFLPGETNYLHFVLRLDTEIPDYGNYTGTAKIYVKRSFS